MTLKDIALEGIESHSNGASWSGGGDYPVGSPEETAWRIGWEIGCASMIRDRREPENAMPDYAIIRQGVHGRKWWAP